MRKMFRQYSYVPVLFLAALLAGTPAVAEELDGEQLKSFLGNTENSPVGRMNQLLPLILAQATREFDGEAWAAITKDMAEADLIERLGPPDSKVQRFEQEGDKPQEVFEYHFKTKQVGQVLLSANRKVLDKLLVQH